MYNLSEFFQNAFFLFEHIIISMTNTMYILIILIFSRITGLAIQNRPSSYILSLKFLNPVLRERSTTATHEPSSKILTVMLRATPKML